MNAEKNGKSETQGNMGKGTWNDRGGSIYNDAPALHISTDLIRHLRIVNFRN